LVTKSRRSPTPTSRISDFFQTLPPAPEGAKAAAGTIGARRTFDPGNAFSSDNTEFADRIVSGRCLMHGPAAGSHPGNGEKSRACAKSHIADDAVAPSLKNQPGPLFRDNETALAGVKRLTELEAAQSS
jgi:hypothetical protein